MEVKQDEVVNAIRWRLGIPVDSNAGRSQEIWARLSTTADPAQRVHLDKVCRFLAETMEQVVRHKLNLLTPRPSPEKAEFLETLWQAFASWMQADERHRSPWVQGLIKHAVSGRKPAPSPERRPPTSAPARVSDPAPSAPAGPPEPPADPVPSPPPNAGPPGGEMPANPEPSRSRPAGPQWRYCPVPEQEPDPHKESEAVRLVPPEGGVVLGARVRGKKHKHEGTNCDDWFEIKTGGPWTVIAVADGAGSRKFSRIGARASCEAAAAVLAKELAGQCLPDCPGPASQATFLEGAVEKAQHSLRNAVLAASFAVDAAAQDRAGSRPHERLLGRPVTPEDLSATLLVAAHTTFQTAEGRRSLVLACQIGDGIVAVVDPRGGVRLLCLPDSGDYSGETDFLTSRRQLEPANLQRKTFVLAGSVRALLVMTDGVSDDYFPSEPGMGRLYADLVLNGILPADEPGPDEQPGPNFDPSDGRLDCDGEYLTADGPVLMATRSAALYASELGIPPERLAAEPALLRAGARGAALAAVPDAAERLRRWLDAYQVRGSFDDRTLVVLHRERAG
jgi:hypothetical protein